MKNMILIGVWMLVIQSQSGLFAQHAPVSDHEVVEALVSEAISSQIAYRQLEWLCKNTAGRICGTPEAAAAVEYTFQVMKGMGLDSVWLQEVPVKSWRRGEPERAMIVSARTGNHPLAVSALGWTPATGEAGMSAPVVEVRSMEELNQLKDSEVQGAVVFFNQPMDPASFNTFSAYGKAAFQRTAGPSAASKRGAVACMVRSLNPETDDHPHTGITRFEEGVIPIPAVAVSTRGADLLSAMLKTDPGLRVWIRTTSVVGEEMISYNVIGEIRGSQHPEKIITVGGHLDAWESGEGAHDDGGGCIQSIEVLRLFKTLGIRPVHTIRAVMFMDEEVAQRGGQVYAAEASRKGEQHIAALESDRGVLRPLAMGISVDAEKMKSLASWSALYEPYQIDLVQGGGGVDIGPLRNYYPGIVFMGLIPDDQRYFRYHHAETDVFEAVDRREMQLGAAAMAILIYLFDQNPF